ncbi:MAG: GNAT family N-acetyltransferase [Shimia sp.]
MTPETVTLQPTLRTERLTLRPLHQADAGAIAMYAGDARVAKMTSSISHPYPKGGAEAFIARQSGEVVWALDASRSGQDELIGVIGLKPLDRGQSEIGYWLAPAMWNMGLAREAAMALVTANPLGNCSIFGRAFQDNPASARVLTHCGFAYLGEAEQFSVARGAHVPTWTYILRTGG